MLLRILIPLIILAAGAGFAYRLSRPAPAPEPGHTSPQVMETEVAELSRTDYTVILESQGIIQAHHESTLTAGVGGTITRILPSFEDGAFFHQGEVLIELDSADFQAAVAASEARLARAEAALAQEEARAKQARLNWDDLGYDGEPSDLVLRLPQLKQARAEVDSALAELDQARRDLERTKVIAPFDGRVRDRLVGLGQAISANTPLGEVFTTEFAEVRLPLTAEQLAFVDLPGTQENQGVPVTLSDAFGQSSRGEPATWRATIVRTEGALNNASRELFVIARIKDPFSLECNRPPLRLGQPVRASIEGRTLEDVFVIPRQALRGLNTIYLVDQENPSILRTRISPIWSTADVVVVRDGLTSGQWLSTTRLAYAPDGAPVRIAQAPSAAGQPDLGTGS